MGFGLNIGTFVRDFGPVRALGLGFLLLVGSGACSELPSAMPGSAQTKSLGRGQPMAAERSASLEIADIQGAAHRSVLEGIDVGGIEGVVTHVEPRGFYLQAVAADSDDRTAEGVFVAVLRLVAEDPGVQVSDRVRVSGTVREHRARCERCQVNERELTQTEIEASLLEIVGQTPLPPEIVLGPEGTRVGAWVEDDAEGDIEREGVRFDPDADALDAYESLEGMRVLVMRPRVVGPSRSGTEFTVVPDGDKAPVSERLGLLAASGPNPQRVCVRVDTEVELNVGDHFRDDLVGVLSGHGPCLLADGLPAVEPAGASSALDWPLSGDNELTLGALNAHNLSRDIEPARLAALLATIVNELPALDILLLTEIQDDSGGRDDGVVSAEQTLDGLSAELARAGAPRYDWVQIDPIDGRDGGQPGANIRQVVLFDAARVSLATASEFLPNNPCSVEPESPAFAASRKPLLVEFAFRGQRLFLLGNHFVAKTADDPTWARFQPPQRPSTKQRRAQAEIVAKRASELLQLDPSASVIVLGDLNDSYSSTALRPLLDAGLYPLMAELPDARRYTYVFEGNAEALDHIFVDEQTRQRVVAFDVAHVDADFARSASDHDPIVVRLAF